MSDPVGVLAESRSLILAGAVSIAQDTVATLTDLAGNDLSYRFRTRSLEEARLSEILLRRYEAIAADQGFNIFPEADRAIIFRISELLRKIRNKASNLSLLTVILTLKNSNEDLARVLDATPRHGEQRNVSRLVPSLANSRSSMDGPEKLVASMHGTDQSLSTMHLLFQPSEIESCDLDVIFVHGVNGDFKQTWQEGSTFWPQDFLAEDLRSARILALSLSPDAFVNVQPNQIAEVLLKLMGTLRRDCSKRKLIWVAHSLGGIIVKSALVRAWKQRDEGGLDWTVCESTAGLLFFGTPHQSSSLSAWSVLYENIAVATGKDPDTIKATSEFVKEMSETAASESDDFKLFIDGVGVPIISFFETKGMNTVTWVPLKVVDRHTELHHPKEDVRFLEGNHVSISKFKDRTDPNYLQVIGCIKHILEEKRFLHPHSKISVLTDESGGSYLEKMICASTVLKDDEIDIEDIEMKDDWSEFRKSLGVSRVSLGHDREKTPAHDPWILQTEELRWWSSAQGPQVLSLVGPPGSGKTTMARAITTFLQYNGAKPLSHRSFVIFFFFRSEYRLTLLSKVAKQPFRNARHYLLQTFVAQLLDRNPVLAGHVVQTMSRRHKGKARLTSDAPSSTVPSSTRKSWSQPTEEELLSILRSMLEDSCHASGMVYCVIDALDQCDSTVVHSMLRMLDSLTSIRGLKLALTYEGSPSLNLPWKHLTKSTHVLLDIVNQDGFTSSMTESLNEAFRSVPLPKSYRMKHDKRRNIFVSIESNKKQSKALTSYEFNWMLFRCLQRFGTSPANDYLWKNIAKWPSLNLVYGVFFENMRNSKSNTFLVFNADTAVRGLEFLSYCYEPIRPSDLQNAVVFADANYDSEVLRSSESKIGEELLKELEELIFLTGEGLHFRSKTLRTFLQTYGVDGYSQLRLNQGRSFCSANVHATMALCCLRFLLTCHGDDTLKRQELTVDIPFLSYAKTYWREHLMDAEGCSFDAANDLNEAQRLAREVRDIIASSDNRRFILSDSATLEDLDHDGRSMENRLTSTPEARRIEDLYMAMSSDIAESSRVPATQTAEASDESSTENQLWNAVVKDLESQVNDILKSNVVFDIKFLMSILRVAMRRRRLSIIKLFLEHIEVSQQGQPMGVWEMGLEMAVEEQSMDIVEFICKTKTSKSFGRSLGLAVSSANITISDYLLSYGANINDRSQGWTVLHIAAHSGPLRLVESLVDWGAKPGTRDGRRRKPIHCAAEAGHADIVLYLRSIGSDVEDVDKKNRTPLFVACVGGWSAAVKMLLDDGCDPNHRDDQGRTMLQVAAKKGAEKVVEYLVAAGSDVNASDDYARTPLHEAAEGGWLSVMKLILDHKADTEAKDIEGNTALHHACKSTNAPEAVVERLILEGAHPDAQSADGCTPLHVASQFSDAAVVKLLIEAEAQVNLQDGEGLTPLHKACASKISPQAKVVALLGHGATAMIFSNKHEDPIEFAILQKQDQDVVELLRREIDNSQALGTPRALWQNMQLEDGTALIGDWTHAEDMDLDLNEPMFR